MTAEMQPARATGAAAGPTMSASQTDVQASEAASRNHVLHVPGMHCAGCMAKIERQINALDAVTAARVNLSLKQLTVTAAEGLDIAVIKDALADIGFPAEGLDLDQLPTAKDNPAKALLIRLAVAGFGLMNVMLLSVSVWSGADAATGQFLTLTSALIALPVLIYAAQPFFKNAYHALRVFTLNMDVPISLAIILAALASLYEALSGGAHAYFDAALALTFFLLGGRYLDLMARQKARSAAAQLSRIETPLARQKRGEEIFDIKISALQPGMIIVVAAGERIAGDGIVRRGRSDSDRSFLTGEAEPVMLSEGDDVFAGEVNLSGPLEIEITKPAVDSVLRRFIDLVEIAERGRDRYRSLADRAAAIYAPLVHVLALVAFGLWFWLSGEVYLALTIAISVLIITCPCALGLAVPAVMTAASGRLFARGVLLKNATALERIAKIDTIVFDKTGTVTNGQFMPTHFDGWHTEEMAALQALARASVHPLARALGEALKAHDLAAVEVTDICEFPGSGLRARYQNASVWLGKSQWLRGTASDTKSDRRLGLRIGRAPIKWLDFEEVIKPGTSDMLACLDQAGMRRILLSGDQQSATDAVARQLGFTACQGAVTPAEKLSFISKLQAEGAVVLMVGDGLNDTAAMAAADAAVAPASALDAARTTADVVLLGGGLENLPFLLATAGVARRRILQNFAIAGLYNLIAVPLALMGIATPLIAAIAMSASSITVSLNAIRLQVARRYRARIQPERAARP
jgi:Cu2+-exporting ATPase